MAPALADGARARYDGDLDVDLGADDDTIFELHQREQRGRGGGEKAGGRLWEMGIVGISVLLAKK